MRLAEAKALITQRRFTEAMAVNAELRREYPTHPRVLLQASRLEGIQGRYRAARACALEAFRHRTYDVPTLALLLKRLQVFHLDEQIHVVIDEIEALPGASPDSLDSAATTLNQMDEPECALRLIDLALSKAPGSAGLLASRAHTLLFLGRFDDAAEDLERCLTSAPEMGFAWWLRSRLPADRKDPSRLAALETVLERQCTGGTENVVMLAYALHHELDALGEFVRAAQALDIACRTKRRSLRYDATETEDVFGQLARVAISPRRQAPATVLRVPIFIVGMHRSGTTLLEQMLSNHADVHALGELYDFPSQLRMATDHPFKGVVDLEAARRLMNVDFEQLGSGYMAAVDRRLGDKPFFTDKLPSNFLNIGAICNALPHARILHMVRDPLETCFSGLREPFGGDTNAFSYDQEEIASYFGTYRRLMGAWHSMFPGRILDVSYSHLTSDPKAALEEVVRHCGLDFQPAMLHPESSRRSVSTASVVQARRPVSSRPRPKWMDYADYLAPLVEAIESSGLR